MHGHLLPTKRSTFPSLEAIEESDKERLLEDGAYNRNSSSIMSLARRVWSRRPRITFFKRMPLAFIFIFAFFIVVLVGLVRQSSYPSAAEAETIIATTSEGQNVSTTRWLFDQAKEKASKLGKIRHPGDTKDLKKVVVLATYSKQDTAWTEDLPEDWSAHKMMMDDRTLQRHSVPRNFGREAMAYLTYIINEYDNLPDVVAFVHGHLSSWHQVQTITSRLEDLNVTHLYQNDFTSLRCKAQERVDWATIAVPVINAWTFVGPFWRAMFPDGDPVTNITDFPQYVSVHNGAQFATTRENLQRRSKEQWERIRWPLIRGVEEFEDLKDIAKTVHNNYNYALGMVYEPIWHTIMGKDPLWQPSLQECGEVQFSNRTVCSYYPQFNHAGYHTNPPKCYRQHWDESLGTYVIEKTPQLDSWKRLQADRKELQEENEYEEAEAEAEAEAEDEDEDEDEVEDAGDEEDDEAKKEGQGGEKDEARLLVDDSETGKANGKKNS